MQPGFITDEARLTAICHQTLTSWPEAKAAVLFGSRARGDHHPNSDWDLAFVTEGDGGLRLISGMSETAETAAAFRDIINVDLWTMGEDTIAARAGELGYIYCAIAADGRTLAGEWNRPQPEEIRMKPEHWLREMRMVQDNINSLFNVYETIGWQWSWSECEASCHEFIARSSDTAEMLVKAMVVRRGQQPRYIHDIAALADEFARQHPEHADLAVRLKSLNGHSTRDHVRTYGSEPFSVADCVRASARIPVIFDLLAHELENDPDGGVMRDNIPKLQSLALRMTTRWREKLEYQIRPKPDADDGEPAENQRAAMAILDGRDSVRAALGDLEARLEALSPPDTGPEP